MLKKQELTFSRDFNASHFLVMVCFQKRKANFCFMKDFFFLFSTSGIGTLTNLSDSL